MNHTADFVRSRFAWPWLIATLIALNTTEQVNSQPAPDQQQRLERFAAQLETYRTQLNIPGMAAGIVQNGQLIWSQGFGWSDVENQVPVTHQTPFHLASLTKTFASQVILKLAEEQKIDLDAPVAGYGVKIPDDPGITVRHLLTHTSTGIPGRNYTYNGSRFAQLGKVIQSVSGKSFMELVTSWIIEPAQMHDTAGELPQSDLDESDADEKTIRVNRALAKPYTLNESFELIPGDYPNSNHLGVSTGLISTVGDMAKYDTALDQHAFITQQSLEEAFTPAVSSTRQTLPYGLGWFVQEFAGKKLIWHYGWEVNYSALILKVPPHKVTFILLANSDCLSRHFSLGTGQVLHSPFAVEFLKTIVFQDTFAEPAPQIAWTDAPDSIAAQLAPVQHKDLRELLRRELIANLVINHRMARTQQAKRLMDTYTRAFTHDAFATLGDQPVLATIDRVGDNAYTFAEFELTQDTPVRVYAQGEGSDNVMYDYGGIEDAYTGRLVWQMHQINTDHAGGARKNRKVDRVIHLPKGMYRLHYRTDTGHSFDNWNDLPPDHNWWGIRVFKASDSASAPSQTWAQAVSPEAHGWSSNKLNALGADCKKLQTTALMVITDGKVVYQWGNTANNVYSHSTRKSLISALYGIYINEGKIDPNATLEQLGITERIPLTQQEKQAKVIDLLRARSGVYIPAASEVKSMRDARPKRGSHKPGTFWYYNNWDFNVLGTIFRQTTGEDIHRAFYERIGRRIGMQDFNPAAQKYEYEENYSIHPGYPFLISTRDMARVGQLFLQKGRWNDQQIIPASWIEESTRSHSVTTSKGRGYGYMWWVVTDDFKGLKPGDYHASGYGGQQLFVLPRLNTVIVHRVDIFQPGIDINLCSNAPFKLLPKVFAAYTGERTEVASVKPVQPLPARKRLPDVAALAYRSTEAHARALKEQRQDRAALWFCVVLLSLAGLLIDLFVFVRPPWRLRLIWLVGVALLGPVGLIAYAMSFRRIRHHGPETITGFQRGLYASIATMVGFAIAMLMAIFYFVVISQNADLWAVILGAYLVTLFIDLVFFRAPFVCVPPDGRFAQILHRTLWVQATTINLGFAGMLPVFALVQNHWYPNGIPTDAFSTPLFWTMVPLSMAAGIAFILPFYVLLCKTGHDASLPRIMHIPADDQAGPKMPALKGLCLAFVLSLVLMLGLIVLTTRALPH